jgi:hypothetical protein
LVLSKHQAMQVVKFEDPADGSDLIGPEEGLLLELTRACYSN